MSEARMSPKQQAKFEKIFFLYGSTVKMLEPVRLTEWQTVAEQLWAWAIRQVDTLVVDCMEGLLDAPDPDPASDPHPAQTKTITVKAVQTVKTGARNGAPWTLSRVVDTANIAYTTFAGHRYTVGESYTITYEETVNGQYVNRSIKEPK